MGKMRGHGKLHKGPDHTPPRHPKKIVDRKRLKVQEQRHGDGRRRDR